ncbi:unnamed protein product, partial [Oppiella nova]
MVGHHFNKVSELTTMGDNTSANALAANDSVFNTSDYITDNQIRANPIVIYIPYALAGAFSIAGAINVLILFIYKRYEPPAKQSNTEHENKDLIQTNKKSSPLKTFIQRNIPPFNTIFMVTMGALFLTFFVGMEQMHLQFLPTFAVSSDLNMSPQAAALVTSASAAAFTVGRGLSIPLAIKLKPEVILYANHVMM